MITIVCVFKKLRQSVSSTFHYRYRCLLLFTAETDALGSSVQLDVVQGYCTLLASRKNGLSLLDFALYFTTTT